MIVPTTPRRGIVEHHNDWECRREVGWGHGAVGTIRMVLLLSNPISIKQWATQLTIVDSIKWTQEIGPYLAHAQMVAHCIAPTQTVGPMDSF